MFGRKATAEDVMKLYSALPDEEKARFLEGVKPKTEDEKQIAEAETDIAEKGEEEGTKDQTEQDVEDESVGEQEHLDGNKTSEPAEEVIAESEGAEAAEEAPQEAAPEADAKTQENREEVFDKLAERVSALETALQEFSDLKSTMEAYTAKQADSFGYNGKVSGGNKSIDDMSAEELKDHILQGK